MTVRDDFEAWAKAKYEQPLLCANMPDGSYNHPTIYANWIGYEGAASHYSAANKELVEALEAVLNAGRGPSGRVILERHQEEAARAVLAKHKEQQ